MAVFGAPDILDKIAQFLAQGSQNFIFVLDRLCGQEVSYVPESTGRGYTVEERNQLIPSPFGAQGKGYGRQTMDCVQSQEHIVVFKLIDQDGDWVELVGLVVHDGGCDVRRRKYRDEPPGSIEMWVEEADAVLAPWGDMNKA